MLYFIFIKKLNLLKFINFIKIYLSYILSYLFKKNIKLGMPFSVSIEPTTNCNLKCKECVSGQLQFTRPEGKIDLEFYKKIIDQTYKFLLNLFIYFQGEPFLHHNFFEMVKYANSKNIFTSTSTNGHFLSAENSQKIIDSKLDKLIISLDGTTQEVYQNYRVGGNLQKVITGIKTLTDFKQKQNSKTPYIVLQFIVMGSNEHQIENIKKLAKELNVNKLELKSVQVYNFEKNVELLPTNKKYLRYVKKESDFAQKSKLRNRCWRLLNSSVITWDGMVLPCCYDKDAKHSFGNLKNETFVEIQNSKKANDFRNMILKNRKSIEICNNCTTK